VVDVIASVIPARGAASVVPLAAPRME